LHPKLKVSPEGTTEIIARYFNPWQERKPKNIIKQKPHDPVRLLLYYLTNKDLNREALPAATGAAGIRIHEVESLTI